MTESKIEWTGRSDWNPIRGCTRVSQGCVHCYAERIAARFSDPGRAFHGFATRTPAGGRWTGRVEVVHDRLLLPLSWRKPALIFGSSTSDLFHEALSIVDIASIFAVAVAAHHLRGHRTQFLTKRASRMRELLASEDFWEIVNAEAGMRVMERVDPLDRRSDDARATLDDYGPTDPAPGVWLGVSVEDQATTEERVPHLLRTPAAIRFLSCEPLLGPVNPWTTTIADRAEALDGIRDEDGDILGIDWIIAGGESGHGARPMHPDWARQLRGLCAAVDVPFLFKQWGEWLPWQPDQMPYFKSQTGEIIDRHALPDFNDGDLKGWTDALLYEGDDIAVHRRVGKKAAGRLLDGIQHDGMPS